MGSKSDAPALKPAIDMLKRFGVAHEWEIVSAHRTPDRLFRYAEGAAARGIKVIIAGAGGAAHLPGMIAAKTRLPVIGLPVKSAALNGLDSLLSIVQMPKGIPVATVAIDGGANAGILAARILALDDEELARKLGRFAAEQAEEAMRDWPPPEPTSGERKE
jgi:5-(carboxyamino)imidazole ribonucleotide mutase